MKREIVNILDIDFDTISPMIFVEKWHKDKKPKTRIAFSNPEFLIEGKKNEFLTNYLNTCSANFPDGSGIIWASKRLKTEPRLEVRYTGTDFAYDIAKYCEEHKLKMFILGGDSPTAKKAKENLLKKYPKLKIKTHQGYIANTEGVLEHIKEFKTDVLMVCMGMNNQEKIISDYWDKLDAKLIFGNGGAVDFLAGNVKRAPSWMQKINLEWLFRLTQDPSRRRIQRQTNLFLFLWVIWVESLMHKK